MKFSLGPNRGSATTRKDVRVEYAPGKRTIPWMRWYIILFLMLSPLLLFLYRSILPWFVMTSPASLVMQKASVSMPRTGTIIESLFTPGTEVKKGDILFRIHEDNLDAKRERLALLRSRLSSLAVPAMTEERSRVISSQGIALASAILSQAKQNRNNVEELIRQRAATDADLKLALQTENQARADVFRARNDLQRDVESQKIFLFNMQRQQDFLRAERHQLENEIAILHAQIVPWDISSPLDGKLLNVGATPGETLTQGMSLATIVNPNSVSILVYADSEVLSFIDKETEVTVRFPGKFSLSARIDRFPTDTQTMPGEFSTFIETKRTIRVFLEPLSPIPPEYLIEGLPLTVSWGVRMPQIFKRFVNETEGL